MAPLAAPISHRCLGLLILVAFELLGVQSWPAWLQVPFLNPHVISNEPVIESSGPEAVLLRQLKNPDVMRSPEKARTLHVAIANILRADGAQMDRVLQHLVAARAAAEGTDEADTILAARLELADAYIEAGRPQDAEHELDAKATYPLLSPENFFEFGVRLDRTNARARFEAGDIQFALETLEPAVDTAVQPEDIVHIACDIAMAHACLGHAQKSLEPLRNALEVVENMRKAETMPTAMHRALAVEVHSRLAEAFHSMGDIASAKAHYRRASHPQTIYAIKTSIANLEKGAGPTLRCPGGARAQKFKLRTQRDAGENVKGKVSSLLAANEHGKAEIELWNYLETQRKPYKSLEAATTLISLGNIYLSAERKSYLKAGHCFIKALQASLPCCGPRSKEAKAAFQGLSFVQDVLPTKERSKAAKAMQEYLSAVDESTTSASDLGQKFKGHELQNTAPAVNV